MSEFTAAELESWWSGRVADQGQEISDRQAEGEIRGGMKTELGKPVGERWRISPRRDGGPN